MIVGLNPTGLQPGIYMGTITLTSTLATNSPVTIPVTLNLGPVVQSLVSAATFQSGGFAPGSIATVFGINLTTSTGTATTLPLPTKLAGLSVTIGGVPAPLYYASPTQVNFDVPYGLPAGPTQLQFAGRGATVSYPILIAGTSPAIFLVGKYAAAIDSDGSINGSGSGFGAAIAGSYVSIYMCGGGGAKADGTLQSSTQAFIGGVPGTVLYAGLNPYLIGVDQINLAVPASLASGDYPLNIYIGGNRSNTPLLKVAQPQ
jgi:adhesin/invasin